MLFAMLATGCGDRVNAAPESANANSYTLTVTGTATSPSGAALLHSATVTLEVLLADPYGRGPSIRSRKNSTTPAKKTSAIRTPGSRFTSGTRSVAAT